MSAGGGPFTAREPFSVGPELIARSPVVCVGSVVEPIASPVRIGGRCTRDGFVAGLNDLHPDETAHRRVRAVATPRQDVSSGEGARGDVVIGEPITLEVVLHDWPGCVG